jgi:hypothetical protein
MARIVATASNKESTNGTTMTQPKRSSLNHTASEAPKYIPLVVDLRPMRLTTGRTYDHKKINNKLINKLIINQEVTTEDTHNPGEEAHR